MSWQEVVSITVVLLGLGAGTFLVAQRPSFWIEFSYMVDANKELTLDGFIRQVEDGEASYVAVTTGFKVGF